MSGCFFLKHGVLCGSNPFSELVSGKGEDRKNRGKPKSADNYIGRPNKTYANYCRCDPPEFCTWQFVTSILITFVIHHSHYRLIFFTQNTIRTVAIQQAAFRTRWLFHISYTHHFTFKFNDVTASCLWNFTREQEKELKSLEYWGQGPSGDGPKYLAPKWGLKVRRNES